jgi:hypothetical protein
MLITVLLCGAFTGCTWRISTSDIEKNVRCDHTPNDTVDIVSEENAKEVINLVLVYLDRNAY